MAAEDFALSSDGRRLAAKVTRPEGPLRGSIAISHPHPAHGGHMDHAVVALAAERAAAAGLVALRFDFGGVRESEGDVADREAHLRELRAAHEAARAEAPGLPSFGAGYSYGARAWLEAMIRPLPPEVAGLLLLAPPTRVPKTSRDFGDLLLGRPLRDVSEDPRVLEGLERLPVRAWILAGDDDVVAPPGEIAAHASPLARVVGLPGLDHFFRSGRSAAREALAPAIDRAFENLLAGAPFP